MVCLGTLSKDSDLSVCADNEDQVKSNTIEAPLAK
eukprot:COSAG06_NODE_64520_length_259_cov_0.650000_1_plen_34_part_10